MIIPTGYAQITTIFSGAAVPYGAAITMGCINTEADSAEAIANTWAAALAAAGITGELANSCGVTLIRVKLGPNSTGLSFDRPTEINGAGGAAGYVGVSALVQKQTGEGGRQNRGRIYWPCVPEGSVAPGGHLEGAFRTALQADMDAILSFMDAQEHPLMVLHSEGVAAAPTPILSLGVQSLTASQRRRNRR